MRNQLIESSHAQAALLESSHAQAVLIESSHAQAVWIFLLLTTWELKTHQFSPFSTHDEEELVCVNFS